MGFDLFRGLLGTLQKKPSPPALRGEMPKAEGGCGPDSLAWLYLAERGTPPLSRRHTSPRSAGGDGVRPVQRMPSSARE